MRGMLNAAAKGKGRATNMALDADQGVEEIITENQMAYTGGANVPVNGTRASTPGKPSSVAVVGALPQRLQSSSDRGELRPSRSQQGTGRTLSAIANSALETPANPLGKHV